MTAWMPLATYRLQFNRDFSFDDATAILPYLRRLGISHVYASPFIKARAGSPHGYDIVEHNTLNPEIGDAAAFDRYIDCLQQQGMGQILDIVPNHMGVGGDDNAWWLDVLEHGEASLYAGYFDIDWHPVNPALHNKVLLPFLGEHYGAVLEQGDLQLGLDPDTGAFSVRYFEHRFPLDPRTYPRILAYRLEELSQHDPPLAGLQELQALIAACKALPRRTELSSARRRQRRDASAACKQGLAALCREQPPLHAFLQENVAHLNGRAGEAKSFDQLHRLLELQAYRLAYWQVASDEINYRRFFDINGLAGIRVENRTVFEATHALIRELIQAGKVQGLRVDHPDGLHDPQGYFCTLRAMALDALGGEQPLEQRDFYLLAEKILASYERLRSDWPIAGTTGYDVAHLLNGLFVYPHGERGFSRLYSRFTGRSSEFDELLYERKKLIIRSSLSSELTVLVNLLSGIAQTDRHTRDFTYQGLRNALSEIVACFPVYRTYITASSLSEEDRRYVQWAVAQAKKRSLATDILIFDFIHEVLLLSRLPQYSAHVRRRNLQFTLRFQQYTAPVMAKGMEDTAFYIYNRLVSLNDVGFDPRSFGITLNAFHHENRQRLTEWPQAMVASSTHDSKRSEDVRARINVLSELGSEWPHHLSRWVRINRGKKLLIGEQRAPSANDEYLFYQTLIGTWPFETLDEAGLAAYRERIAAYMHKAIKEAKVHTSWINPHEEYEQAMQHFVQRVLDRPEHNAFLADFLPFQQRIARLGACNSLSQTLLKHTIPGVPDTYQGTELWSLTLVDPDNRRPVDYVRRVALLDGLAEASAAAEGLPGLLRELLEGFEDGRIKLYLTWQLLQLRQAHPALFQYGGYQPLNATGSRADHICAFARSLEAETLVTAAPRWFASLTGEQSLPLGRDCWQDTLLEAPLGSDHVRYVNVLTRQEVTLVKREEQDYFDAGELFRDCPVALLLSR